MDLTAFELARAQYYHSIISHFWETFIICTLTYTNRHQIFYVMYRYSSVKTNFLVSKEFFSHFLSDLKESKHCA